MQPKLIPSEKNPFSGGNKELKVMKFQLLYFVAMETTPSRQAKMVADT